MSDLILTSSWEIKCSRPGRNSSPCPNSCPAFAPRGNTIREVIENLFIQDHTLLLICMCPWLVGSSGLWITFLYSIDNFILPACSWIDFHWTFVCASAYVRDTLTEARGQPWDLLFLGGHSPPFFKQGFLIDLASANEARLTIQWGADVPGTYLPSARTVHTCYLV